MPRKQKPDLTGFDFSGPAELFAVRSKAGRSRFTYKRFDTGAEAVRFAVEDMPRTTLRGVYLRSEDTRFGEQEIRTLYESCADPLTRRAPAD